MNKESESINLNLSFFIGLFFGLIWIELMPAVIVGYWFFQTFPFQWDGIYLLWVIALIGGLLFITFVWSLLVTKIGIWIVHKRIAYPQLGSYPLSMGNPQTKAFIIKGNVKSFARWLFLLFRSQWLRVFWLRRMGVKIGKKVKVGRHMQDEEFIEIGDHTFMAKNTIFSGHLMDQTTLTINKTVVGKNCIFEPISGSVGGIVGDNSYFIHRTGAMKGQICRGNAIYEGIPCKKVRDNNLSETEIEAIKQKILEIDRTDFIKQKNAVIKINEFKLFGLKLIVVISGLLCASIIVLLYTLLFQSLYDPLNIWTTILLLALVPFIFIITMGFFVVGVASSVKLLLMHYDKQGEIPEGTYEVDSPIAQRFKIKYLLRLFGLNIFRGTPLRIGDTFAMKWWGNVKLGRNIVLSDALVDPQYVEIGDSSILAAHARIHTHEFIDGKLFIKKVKLGKMVLAGAYAHLKPGVEIADRSVLAVGVWFRKNRICKNPALWIGKPACELPLEILTKSARLEGKYVD